MEQTNSAYLIERDVTATEHAIRLVLPNLHNGDPGFLHLLDVAFARAGYPTLLAERQVYAAADDDSNDDGIPDSWEQKWGIPVGDLVAGADDDFDGFSNTQEYIADTDPRGSNDFLVLESGASVSNGFALGFLSSSNRNYFVSYLDSMHTTNWQLATPLTDPIEGTGQTNQFTDTLPNLTNRYYRLHVDIPGA